MKIRTLYIVLILCLLFGLTMSFVEPFLGKIIVALSIAVMGAVQLLRKFDASKLKLLGINMEEDFFGD